MPPLIARSLGLTFWLAAIAAAAWGWSRRPVAKPAAVDLGDTKTAIIGGGAVNLTTGPRITAATDPTRRHRPGDPIFGQSAAGEPIQIGHVAAVQRFDDAPSEVAIQWYVDFDGPTGWRLNSHRTTGGLDEVAAMMLPPAKRQRIADRVADAMREHGNAVTAALTPLVTEVVRRSLPVIEAELAEAINRHREEIDSLTQRYQKEIVTEKLMPLVRSEVLPIIRKHGQPPAEEIGREIWARAPVWRFGLKAIYDKTPLPERDMLREEFDQFVDNDVVPVIEDHADEIVVAIQRSLIEASANPRVRSAIRASAEQIAADPEARAIVATIMREAIVENRSLREVWASIWSDPRARAAVGEVSQRIEPVLRGIGDDLIGTPARGIDPDFARVLRNQILGKDRRWITAVPATDRSASPVIRPAQTFAPYPVIHLVNAT